MAIRKTKHMVFCLDHVRLIQQIAEKLHNLCKEYRIPDEIHEYNWICKYAQEINANHDTDLTRKFRKLCTYARWHCIDITTHFLKKHPTEEESTFVDKYSNAISNFVAELDNEEPMFEGE